MRTPRRICLVSPGHVASNPRLVKEADALHEAGYDVHVVSGWYYPPLDVHDVEIFNRAGWARSTVYYLTGPRVLLAKFRREFARRRLANTPKPGVELSLRAIHPALGLLTRAAARIEADLFIGHCLPGLPAAARAAKSRGVRYGFDAEDFHLQETEQRAAGGSEAAAVRAIESHFLPHCAHLTASSPLISRACADTYGVPEPLSLLNVFPLAEAPARPHAGSVDGGARLYWFSQTIGHGRGLEQLIVALGQMQTRCELHLRGIPVPDFMDQLRQHAREAGFHGRIDVLPTAPAHEMARLAAGYDLGLSLEQSWPPNRDLCLTNKLFTYLLAGVPVALTPTRAQAQLAPALGDAAFLLDLQDAAGAAREIDAFFSSPERRQRARGAAWKLARERFNWDLEKTRFLASVANVFESPLNSGTKR